MQRICVECGVISDKKECHSFTTLTESQIKKQVDYSEKNMHFRASKYLKTLQKKFN